MANSYHTQQATALREAGIGPSVAELLGLSFADRDLEVIERLKEMEPGEAPEVEDFPDAPPVAQALGVELRWAAFTLEKVQRFVHKRRMNGDYTTDIKHFAHRPDVLLLRERLRALRPGLTAFIGDSMMDNRHFSANASFAVLVGGLLESLGLGPYVNAGIGGNTAAQGLARYERDVLSKGPVRVVLSFGSNDVSNGVPLETIAGQFEQLIDGAKGVGAEVLVGLALPVVRERLWWMKGELQNSDLESRRGLQRMLEEVAERKGVRCMNVIDKLRPEHYCVDGIHLEQGGQEVCGTECLEQLAKTGAVTNVQ
jgi:lysophospholipase L1-like esterase